METEFVVGQLQQISACMLKPGFTARKTEKIGSVFCVNCGRIAWKEKQERALICIQLRAKASQLYFLHVFTKLT